MSIDKWILLMFWVARQLGLFYRYLVNVRTEILISGLLLLGFLPNRCFSQDILFSKTPTEPLSVSPVGKTQLSNRSELEELRKRIAQIEQTLSESNPVGKASLQTAADNHFPTETTPGYWQPDDHSNLNPTGSSLQRSPDWLDSNRVGYDGGFVMGSDHQLDLRVTEQPFHMQLNGWGQLRHTMFASDASNSDLNQIQLKRGRLALSGSAFTTDFHYFLQMDGRSSSGDSLRLLDYFLSYDIGHHSMGLEKGVFGFRTGKYKMPVTLARHLSARDFEFSDRTMASTYFDVNRSLAWGLYGRMDRCCVAPLNWEVAVFNGLVTGGAETGSSGSLDNNFAYSGRMYSYPTGDWGSGALADFESHKTLATRFGAGFARSKINRSGSTEFTSLRVVDTGEPLGLLVPDSVDEYTAYIYSIDGSLKLRGWSATMEYYIRSIQSFQGAAIPDVSDHGLWLQFGKFVVPEKFQLLARWSRVQGDSETLGNGSKSADEVSGGFAWYFRGQHAKLTLDLTHLDGAPIDSSSLGISPGDSGWLMRSQIQFAF